MVTAIKVVQIECPSCRLKIPRPRQATTVTCPNCGKVTALDDRFFDRRYVFKGEVLTRGKITVGPQGVVKGNLSATEIAVLGMVEGDVKAVEKLVLAPGARLFGNVISGCLIVEEGAVLHGKVTVGFWG